MSSSLLGSPAHGDDLLEIWKRELSQALQAVDSDDKETALKAYDKIWLEVQIFQSSVERGLKKLKTQHMTEAQLNNLQYQIQVLGVMSSMLHRLALKIKLSFGHSFEPSRRAQMPMFLNRLIHEERLYGVHFVDRVLRNPHCADYLL